MIDPAVVKCNCSRPPPSCFRAGGAEEVSSSALCSLLPIQVNRQPLALRAILPSATPYMSKTQLPISPLPIFAVLRAGRACPAHAPQVPQGPPGQERDRQHQAQTRRTTYCSAWGTSGASATPR